MLLKIGSNGPEVKALQTRLGLKPDGNFGPNTESALKAWQKANGLEPDGIVGQRTWDKLNASTALVDTQITQNETSTGFKLDKLKGVIPDQVISQIPETAQKFGITTVLRLSHFLAQCSNESGGFKVVNENLNYSEKRLVEVFPRYFKDKNPKDYGNRPEKIASLVYGNRMGNGNEASGEGYKFRGRGYIQLTGKANYSAFSKFIGEDTVSNPDLVSTKYPLASAAFFFQANGLWPICDLGSTADTVKKVTIRVNGGTLGLGDRIEHFNLFYSLLK